MPLGGDLDLYRILHVHPSAHPAVIQAAYHALARMLHPDQTATGGHDDMALVNRAYAILRDPEKRRAYDRYRSGASAASTSSGTSTNGTPGTRAPASGPTSRERNVLPHGRYAGWSLEQLVRHDPDYLRWLSRHTSGLRFRSEITRLLAPMDARRFVSR